MPTVLFLGASVSQLEAMRYARNSAVRVVAVDGDPDAIGFAEADVSEVVDFSSVDDVIDVARRHRIDGVLAISTDRAVPVAATVAERLGLPGIGTETAHAMTDKATMRARLAAAGIPQPAHAIADVDSDLMALLDNVGHPAVLKPVDSGGQRGVSLIDDISTLERRLPETLSFSRSGRAILEQYVDGSELNGIIVVIHGEPHLVTLSDRLRPPGVGFGVGWIHLYPSSLSTPQLARAERVALDAVRALGLQNGIAFPQLLVTATEAYVVEVAARIPAGQMADLVRLAVGVDLVEIALRQALANDVGDCWQAKFQRPLAIRFFTAQPGLLPVGRISTIDGLEDVRNSSGVLKADLYMRPGEIVRPVQVDADRRGYVIAEGADSNDALDRANRAARKLVVCADLMPVTRG